MLGDLTRDDVLALVPEVAALSDEKLERVLDLADDLEAVYPGSYVEIVIHAPGATYRDRDLTDNARLYSVRIKPKGFA